MSDEPHERLWHELELLWREQRRQKLAEAGIEVRRPRHNWPEPNDDPGNAEEFAIAFVDLQIAEAGGIDALAERAAEQPEDVIDDLVARVDEQLELLASHDADDALALFEVTRTALVDELVLAFWAELARRGD